MINWVEVLGGFGVFLYSLRFLNRLLLSNLNGPLRTRLRSVAPSRWQSGLLGLMVTLLVQASSITVLAAMGLVGASILPIERAFLVGLGAGVGTTAKAWVVGLDLLRFGPLLIGVGSLLLVVVRDRRLRLGLELMAAVGFAFSGLHSLSNGLRPLAHSELFNQLMDRFSHGGLYETFLGVGTGLLVSAVLQSSSAVVALVIILAQEGSLNVIQGATLILGANVGTTITPLLAALEYGVEVRRLAVANCLSKLLGVVITVLLFPQFLTVVLWLVQLAGQGNSLQYSLAAVHTGFNVMELICWGMLPWPVLALSQKLIRSAGSPEGSNAAVPLAVRKLFSHNPGRCAEECDQQLRKLGLLAKSVTDGNFRALCLGRWVGSRNEVQQAEFEAIREAIVDLLVRALRAEPGLELQRRLDGQLRRLTSIERLLLQSFQLRERLKEGLSQGVTFSASQLEAHRQFADAWRTLWTSYLTGEAPDLHLLRGQIPQALAAASASFVAESEHHIEMAPWMFTVYGSISGLAHTLREILDQQEGPLPELPLAES